MEGETKNFFKACIAILTSLCYSYFLASKIPKGMLRFISLLPIFSLLTLLPLSLSRPIPNILLGSFITWLTNFKLLLYSFNLGPLSTNNNNNNHPQKSLLRFLFLASFPIKIKEKKQVKTSKDQNLHNNNQKGSFVNSHKKVLPLNFWSKCVLFVIMDVTYRNTKNMMVLCCLMYLFNDIAFGVCDRLVGATLGLELESPSDEPYLSSSLQNFWGNRWNRMISDILRHTVYKPVKSMVVYFVGHTWAPMPGVLAAFVVSGLMHELVYYYVTRVSPTWEVTLFFVLHGVCVILEMVVKKGLGQKWRLHWAISGPLTIGFVMVTSHWLFFPQLLRNQVDVRAAEDIMGVAKYLKEVLMKVNIIRVIMNY
ncbi:long-chain-alcohol O-fatty-acyltransferase-like [Beta vulgaris subsp. vulgaris]|uniref:long-chain-alcohol O-fatty-acyltransferase-like n=1 Tax=Beta vulgaris subsp. vulgaris TaxID=3555 RepID=UPI002547DBEF|nr:long-chain-alcohol O-fatty-acyltransferase-like [Beta vulgaris subsp. vulgaris]